MSYSLTGGKFQAFTNAGALASGYKLYTYSSGTTTNKATYTDYTLGTANANPITLDARGEASVWLGTGAYTFVLKDASGVTIWTVDGVQDQSNLGSDLVRSDLADTATVSKGAGMVGFNTSTAYTSGTVGYELKRVVYVDSFTGVDPTGASDSSVGIAAAQTALVNAGGGDLVFGSGTYKCAGIAIPSGVHWVGKGRSKTKLTKATSGSLIASMTGTVGTASNLSANVSAGVMQVTVASTSALSIGGYALIREDTYVSGSAGRKQQVLRIRDIVGSTVKFSQPLFEAYTTAANAQVLALTPVQDSGIHDMTLEGINSPSSGGLFSGQYLVDVELSGVAGRYFTAPGGFVFQTAYNSNMIGCFLYDGVDIATSGQGYGYVFDESCAMCEAVNCYSENVRENLFTNRSTHCKFRDCTAVGNYDSGFNTHGAQVTHCAIEDCKVIGTQAGAGIAVGWSSHTAGDTDIAVRRNHVRATASTGIAVNAPVGKENYRIALSENKVFSPGIVSAAQGVFIGNTVDWETSDNVVDGSTTNISAGFYFGSAVRGESSDDLVRSVPSGYGFRLVGCTDVNINNPVSRSVSSYNFYGDGTNTTCYIQGAVTDDATESLGAGLTKEGRIQRGTTTLTLTAQNSKSATITFPVPFPTGVTPVIELQAGNDASGQWVTGFDTLTNTGFIVTITDRSGTARTGTVNLHWTATE